MATRKSPRPDHEWLSLITQCRRSGMCDADWCRMNDIPVSTFYNAVGRLRRKACKIPEGSKQDPCLDLTSAAGRRQDVVRIEIEPEEPSAAPCAVIEPVPAHLDNVHTIEISVKDVCIRICNGADPELLASVLSYAGR